MANQAERQKAYRERKRAEGMKDRLYFMTDEQDQALRAFWETNRLLARRRSPDPRAVDQGQGPHGEDPGETGPSRKTLSGKGREGVSGRPPSPPERPGVPGSQGPW